MRHSATLIQTILVAAIAATSISCRRIDNVVYSQFWAFGSEGWDPVCPVNFAPWPVDSIVNPADRFDMILTLRYSPKDASAEIPIEITEEDENGVIDTRRVTMRLRHENGNLRGHRSVFLYEISDTLRKDFRIPDGYSVSVTSLSPGSNTLALRNIGLTLTSR